MCSERAIYAIFAIFPVTEQGTCAALPQASFIISRSFRGTERIPKVPMSL